MEQTSDQPKKKKAGNPNFGKGNRNPYYGSNAPKKSEKTVGEKDETTVQKKNDMPEVTTPVTPPPPVTPPNNSTPPVTPVTPPPVQNGPPPPPPVVNPADAPKELPVDLFSDDMPLAEELPLDGEVVKQVYGALNENGNGTPPTPPKPGDPVNTSTPPVADPSGAAPAAPVVPKTPDEVRSEAEQLVKMLLKGYDKLHGLGRWAGKVDDGKLAQEHIEGKINLQQELPIGKTTITVAQFFQEYNMGIDDNIVVTPEFNETITPPLIRIAIKHGWGVGDELFCALTVAEDLATKVSLLIGLNKSANLVLNACHALMKKQNEANADGEKRKHSQERTDNPQERTDETTEFTDIPNNPDDQWREQ